MSPQGPGQAGQPTLASPCLSQPAGSSGHFPAFASAPSSPFSGQGHQAGRYSAPLWGGSLATGVHLSDPLIGTGLSLSTCNAGGLGLIPGLGRSPGEGNGYPLQYSGLENSMDGIVHGASKRWTGLSDFHSLSLHLRGRGSPAFLEVPIPLQI